MMNSEEIRKIELDDNALENVSGGARYKGSCGCGYQTFLTQSECPSPSVCPQCGAMIDNWTVCASIVGVVI